TIVWRLSYRRQVLELLAERGIDVSHRTVLNWVQTLVPQLAAEVRRHRCRTGTCWFVDEVLLFRKSEERHLYRTIDEDDVVVDVLLRKHRDTARAEAFFRLVRTGLYRARGETTKAMERSHLHRVIARACVPRHSS